MNITVKITQNYGVEAIYPVCEAALTFARLAGTKTLTRSTIALIKRLGYTVNVQQDEVQL
jgi:hypothetical protein